MNKYIDADRAKNGIMKFVNENGEIVGMFVNDFNILLERCAADDCPSKECRIKITNNHFNAGDIISVADLSGVCRFYIGWVLNKMEGEEE